PPHGPFCNSSHQSGPDSLRIAAMTTLLSRGAQSHQAALVKHINPYNPVLQERLQEMTHALPGSSSSTEMQQAYAAIYGMVAKQAMVLSYIDNFRILSFLCLLCVPAVFLFKRVRARKGAVAMH